MKQFSQMVITIMVMLPKSAGFPCTLITTL